MSAEGGFQTRPYGNGAAWTLEVAGWYSGLGTDILREIGGATKPWRRFLGATVSMNAVPSFPT